MKLINVLITGGGAPGIAGTIYSLRNNYENRNIRIITVDARDNVIGKYMSDGFYVIPKYNDPTFLNSLLEISKKEKIDVILPQVTKELFLLSENIEKFKKIGVKVVVSDIEAMNKANNKYLIMKEFSSLGYDQGVYSLIKSKKDLIDFAEKCGYPNNMFVVKVPVSNGMRGLRVIRDKKLNINEFLNEKPNGIYSTLEDITDLFNESNNLTLVGMQYFSGPEYTIDVYRSPLTNKTIVIPRIRSLIRTGITFEGETIKDKTMIEASKRLADSIDLQYCFGFQFKLDKDDKIHILESNPRIQGTMIMSVLSGANMIYWSVKEAIGEKVDLDNINIKWGTKFRRYWGGLVVEDNEIHKIC
jgi:carbamoyl-phosphate synthase large subunit